MQKLERKKKARTPTQVVLRLQSLTDPSVVEYVNDLKATYGKYALPVKQVRRIVDRSMGKRTLSEVLRRMREESY